jgi:proline iminopeptidase
MGFGGDLRTFNFLEDLHKITCPTLLIGGRHDWITPIGCTHEISSRIPDCKTVILEDSSHSIFADQYDESIKAITDFVADRL